MKRLIAVLAIVCMFSATAWAAQEQGKAPEGPGFGGPGMHMVKSLERLNLSPEQKHSVAVILKNNREEAKKLFEGMKQAHHALREVMTKTPGDEAAIRAAYKPVSEAGEKLVLHHAKVKAQIDAVLTPDQRAQAQKEREEFKGKMKERMEKGRQAFDNWIDENSK